MAHTKDGKAKMPKYLWLGLSVVGALFYAIIFWHSSKSARMIYVRILPVMNLVLFYFEVLALGILLIEYLYLHEVLVEERSRSSRLLKG